MRQNYTYLNRLLLTNNQQTYVFRFGATYLIRGPFWVLAILNVVVKCCLRLRKPNFFPLILSLHYKIHRFILCDLR